MINQILIDFGKQSSAMFDPQRQRRQVKSSYIMTGPGIMGGKPGSDSGQILVQNRLKP